MGRVGKNKKYILLITLIIFLNLTNIIHSKEIGKENNIIILSSYHINFGATKNQVDSVINKINSSQKDINIYVEYMDWKNINTNRHLTNLYKVYKEKYRKENINLIVAIDDIALDFAIKHRGSLFGDAPIVFSGVNEEGVKNIVKDFNNVTGVVEPVELESTVDMAIKINPNVKKMYIIHDETESGKSTYEIVEKTILEKYPNIWPVGITNKSNNQIISQVRNIEEDSAILITVYYKDIVGNKMTYEEFCRLISDNSKVPVFHMYDFTLGHGNVGGSVISPKILGQKAGDIVNRILDGEDINNIEIVRDQGLVQAFDYNELKKFNISKKNLPRNATIINEPFIFLKRYKVPLLIVILVILILLLLVIRLKLSVNELKRVRNELQQSNEEITQTYEELTASDEELNKQVIKLDNLRKELSKMAYYDVLTNLPNKRSLYQDIENKIIENQDKKFGIIFIDADNFKLINDTLGHSVGDKFLIAIGNRLKESVGEKNIVYRMGGDEFIILVSQCGSKNYVESVAKNIMKSFKEGFKAGEMVIHTTVSAGITIYPDHGDNAEILIMRSDIAMYKAKELGKSNYVFYNTQMNDNVIERAKIEINLRNALENNELYLNYQPQYDFKTQKIIGFEALLRWKNDELGEVSPLKFITVAEESHIIISIGKWVLDEACKFIKKTHKLTGKEYTIAVNISLLQVMQEDFVDIVLEALRKNSLEPKYLEIEITETMLMENFNLVSEKLDVLIQYGIKIALDDFGTGYSSLSYLEMLPLNTLKIDKSFVDTISQRDKKEVIIGTLIALGHRMGLKVIAEGVETQEEFNYLLSSKCDSMQGYFLSKPLLEEEAIKQLKMYNNHNEN